MEAPLPAEYPPPSIVLFLHDGGWLPALTPVTDSDQQFDDLLPYDHAAYNILKDVDLGFIPPLFSELVNFICPKFISSGCITMEIRDYRYSALDFTYLKERGVVLPSLRHRVLRPAADTLLTDLVEHYYSVTKSCVTPDEIIALERLLYTKLKPSLRLDLTPQDFDARAMKQYASSQMTLYDNPRIDFGRKYTHVHTRVDAVDPTSAFAYASGQPPPLALFLKKHRTPSKFIRPAPSANSTEPPPFRLLTPRFFHTVTEPARDDIVDPRDDVIWMSTKVTEQQERERKQEQQPGGEGEGGTVVKKSGSNDDINVGKESARIADGKPAVAISKKDTHSNASSANNVAGTLAGTAEQQNVLTCSTALESEGNSAMGTLSNDAQEKQKQESEEAGVAATPATAPSKTTAAVALSNVEITKTKASQSQVGPTVSGVPEQKMDETSDTVTAQAGPTTDLPDVAIDGTAAKAGSLTSSSDPIATEPTTVTIAAVAAAATTKAAVQAAIAAKRAPAKVPRGGPEFVLVDEVDAGDNDDGTRAVDDTTMYSVTHDDVVNPEAPKAVLNAWAADQQSCAHDITTLAPACPVSRPGPSVLERAKQVTLNTCIRCLVFSAPEQPYRILLQPGSDRPPSYPPAHMNAGHTQSLSTQLDGGEPELSVAPTCVSRQIIECRRGEHEEPWQVCCRDESTKPFDEGLSTYFTTYKEAMQHIEDLKDYLITVEKRTLESDAEAVLTPDNHLSAPNQPYVPPKPRPALRREPRPLSPTAEYIRKADELRASIRRASMVSTMPTVSSPQVTSATTTTTTKGKRRQSTARGSSKSSKSTYSSTAATASPPDLPPLVTLRDLRRYLMTGQIAPGKPAMNYFPTLGADVVDSVISQIYALGARPVAHGTSMPYSMGTSSATSSYSTQPTTARGRRSSYTTTPTYHYTTSNVVQSTLSGTPSTMTPGSTSRLATVSSVPSHYSSGVPTTHARTSQSTLPTQSYYTTQKQKR
eukprot:m.362838 g.362838  ORF g.362838 m.362838 type:complete len:988 (-) comp21004_c0_seq1:220-3183(-)